MSADDKYPPGREPEISFSGNRSNNVGRIQKDEESEVKLLIFSVSTD